MAQSYTRQSTFSDGDTITASLFNNEYNQLLNSFSYSASNASTTGHRHDGTAGQGGNIFKVGDLDFLNKIEVDSTNNRWGFYVEVSSAAVEQIRVQDGAIVPVTDNDIDLGTSSLQFKDIYINGTANLDSLVLSSGTTVTVILDEDDLSTNSATALATQQSIKAYVDAQVTAQDFDFSADSGGALSIDLDSEAMTFTGGTGIDTSGSGNAVTFAIDSTVATLTGSQTLTNKTITSPDINGGTVDGATIATSDITVGSGKTLDVSAGTLTIANNQISGDKVEGGTIAATTITDLTFGSLDDGTINITAFVDEDNMSSDSATLVPTQQSVKAYVDSQVTAQDLDVTTDSGTIAIDLDSETLTVSGGTGLDSSATGNAITVAIDSTVATLTGSQTLTNKTLTAPVISGNLTTDGLLDGRDVAADGTKLDGVEASADVTDTTNVTAAGALMDSEVTNLAQVKAFDSSDYATAAQGTTADAALPKAGGAMTGAITTNSTFDGRDVATDGTKLDGIEASADVTDTANVTSAGALMDSELAAIASVKALNQGVATGDSPTFTNLTLSGTGSVKVPAGTTAQRSGSPAAGMFRYNSSLAQFEGYTDAWGAIGGGGTNTFTTDSFTGNGSTTAYALSQTVSSEDNLLVFIEGVFQQQDAYSIATSSGTTTLTFSAAPANSNAILIYSVAAGISGSNLNIDSMTGDGSDTTLTLSISPVNENNTQVFIDGVYQSKSNYSISGTTLTFSTAPPLGTAVEVMTFTQTDINVPVDGTITSAKLSGALTTPAALTVTGDLITTTSGTSNTRIGVNAGNSIVSGGDFNTVVGDEAGTAITTGDRNTFIGYLSGTANDTGIYNTFIGSHTGSTHTVGYNNVAVGTNAFAADVSSRACVAIGSSALRVMNNTNTDAYNTAVGFAAGAAVTTGLYNTLVGGLAGDALTDADYNTGLGYLALSTDTLGSTSTAVGAFALRDQNLTTATDVYNTAVGYNAGGDVTVGFMNTLIGGLAGDALTDADYNVAIGFHALGGDTLGSRSVAIGTNALFTQNFTTATDAYNIGVGFNAGQAITTGVQNTLIGSLAGDALTNGGANVALGYEALSGEDANSYNTAIGYQTLKAQNASGNAYNTAVGAEAGKAVTTGIHNTFVGGLAGDGTQGGGDNTAVGLSALSGVCGNENVAVGKNSLLVSTAGRNTAIGWGAGDSNTTGGGNVYIGYDCAAYQNNATTGADNTYIGAFARGSSATVSSEIAIGRFVLGQGTATATIGINGNGATISIDGSDTSWSAHSDERLKENITTSTAGLSFINDLRPVTYTWKAKNAISEDFVNYYDADSTDPVNGTAGKTYHGFVAQEMKATIDAHSEVANGNNLWAERVDDIQQLAPGNLVPMLVKAIQEQSALITAQAAAITDLTTRLTALENN